MVSSRNDSAPKEFKLRPVSSKVGLKVRSNYTKNLVDKKFILDANACGSHLCDAPQIGSRLESLPCDLSRSQC